MKIESQILEDYQVRLQVELDNEKLDLAKQQAARRLAKRTKIPGFRPGKAPFHVVQRLLGDEAILEEGLELLINDLYPEIIKQSGIQTYGPGKFEKVLTLEPLVMEFTVPLAPETVLGDYKSLRLPYQLPQVSEQDVQEALDNLRQRQAIEEPANRSAMPGDRVYLRISGIRQNPSKVQNPVLIKEQPFSVLINSPEADNGKEWPFPGFSLKLVGMKAGDETTFVYTFPDDSEIETLRGVTGEFSIVIEEVKSHQLPELNDEFAQSVGEYENLAALISFVRNHLEQEAADAYHEDYDYEVLDKLIDESSIKFPPQMLKEETEDVVRQFSRQLESQNLDLETYLKTRSMDKDKLMNDLQPVALLRLKRSLTLLKLAEVEKIQVDKDEVQTETEKTLQSMSRFMSEKELRKVSPQDYLPNLIGNIYTEMSIKRAMERLRSISKGELESELLLKEPPQEVLTSDTIPATDMADKS